MFVKSVKNRHHYRFRENSGSPIMLFMLIQDKSVSAATVSSDKHLLHDIHEIVFDTANDNSDTEFNQLNFFLNDSGFNKTPYQSVSVQLLSRHYTIVPKEFSENDLKKMLYLNTGISDTEHVLHNHVNNDVTIAFSINAPLKNFIEKTFNTAKIKHAGASAIELFLKLPSFSKEQVFLNIHKDYIELLIKNNKTLQFYNVFKWEANEDILYFTLFTMEQYALSPSSARLTIAANIPADDLLFVLLKKYVKHVQLYVSKLMDNPVNEIPNHYYFNILNDYLCE
jgi:hypothetical protein